MAIVGGVLAIVAAVLIIVGLYVRVTDKTLSVTTQQTITNGTGTAALATPAVATATTVTPMANPPADANVAGNATDSHAGGHVAFPSTIAALRKFAKEHPNDPLVVALRDPKYADTDVLPYGESDKNTMGGSKLRSEVARIRRMNAFDNSNTMGVLAAQRVLGDRCAVQFGHSEQHYRQCKAAQRKAQHVAIATATTDAGNAQCGMIDVDGMQNTMIAIPAAK